MWSSSSHPSYSSNYFLGRVTADLGSGDYSFTEQWLVGGASTPSENVAAGRSGSAAQPGRCVTGAALAVGDWVLVRSADGEGGLKWELVPISAPLTVEEEDGVITVTNVTKVQFHQGDGFVVEEPEPGTALIRLLQPTNGYVSSVTIYGSYLRITNTRYVNGYPVHTYTDIPRCPDEDCCAAAPLVVTAVADEPGGGAPHAVEFTVTVAGGVGPYSVTIDYDDGDTDADSGASPFTFNHTFTEPGLYEITVTVIDACEAVTSYFEYVYVYSDPCTCAQDDATAWPVQLTFTVAGGTGIYAGANGDWTVYLWQDGEGNCAYAGDLDGTDPRWTATAAWVSPDYTLLITLTNGLALLEYTATEAAESRCADPQPVELSDSGGAGVGTEDVGFDVSPGGACYECSVEACGCVVPSTLYLHDVTCACAGSSIPLVYNAAGANGAGWYSATIADCDPGNHALYFRWYCDPDDGWLLEEWCDGANFTGAPVTPGEGCPDTFPCAGTTPGSNICCDLASTWTISTTP